VRKSLGIMAAAAALGLAATPIPAQKFSNAYTFMKAVKDRDGNKVTEMTSGAGADIVINTKEPGTGDSALHIVANGRDRAWLSFLLSKGARVDQQNDEGETALSIAAKLGWFEGAELLVKRGAAVDIANDRGETPLILAVQRRDLPVVRLLLSRGADPLRTDNVAGYSALDYAKRDGRSAAVVRLLEAPVAPAREIAGPKL